MNIGKRIRELRLEGGWTQKEVAQAIGVTSGLISQLERGETHSMSLPHMKAAAKFFRVDLDWLADGTGSRKPRSPLLVLSDRAVMIADDIDRLDDQSFEIVAAMVQKLRK